MKVYLVLHTVDGCTGVRGVFSEDGLACNAVLEEMREQLAEFVEDSPHPLRTKLDYALAHENADGAMALWKQYMLNEYEIVEQELNLGPAPCVIMKGNLNEGFRVVGPFSEFDVAACHDADYFGGGNWVATLHDPWSKHESE